MSLFEKRENFDIQLNLVLDELYDLPNSLNHQNEDDLITAVIESSKSDCTKIIKDDFSNIVSDIKTIFFKSSLNTTSPTFFAYMPGGGIPMASLADFIESHLNRYFGVSMAAPYFNRIESNVIKWLGNIIGFQENCSGVLTSGGSMANFYAVCCAINRKAIYDRNVLAFYFSDQTHSCIYKALKVLGISKSQIKVINSNDNQVIEIIKLREKIISDKKEGLIPCMLIGNVGTVNSGGIDDIETLSSICRSENIWLHLDAAYGGFFNLAPSCQFQLKNMQLAESVTVDPHKSLFMPYGIGALIVRDKNDLLTTFSPEDEEDYLPDMEEFKELTNFAEMSLEMSRNCRGFKIWMCLKYYGEEVFSKALEHKRQLAIFLDQNLRQINGVNILTATTLSIVNFNYNDDETTKKLYEKITSRRKVALSSTQINRKFSIRINVLNHKTKEEHIDILLNEIKYAIGSIDG